MAGSQIMSTGYDYEATRVALSVMTAWASSDGTDFPARVAVEQMGESGIGAERLVIGFINLTGMLLVMRHAERDVRPQGTLQDLALRPWNTRE